MVDLNQFRNLSLRRRANCLRCPLLLPALVAAAERQALLVFAYLFSVTPVSVQAQFNYSITNAAVTITRYTGNSGAVSIPSQIDNLPVTAIGEEAFYGTGLASVSIPTTVTSIGNFTFGNCIGLTNVSIPASVISIGSYGFNGCASLTSISIPTSVTNMGAGVFWDCISLTSATIPAKVTSIGYGAFGRCSSLTSVNIPSGITSIGGYAFWNCTSLSNVSIPASVTNIGESAFLSTGLTGFIIPNSVEVIGYGVFESCSHLTSATISNSVIGNSEFYGCASLSNVTMCKSVTRIEEAAFEGCTSLSKLYFEGNEPALGGLSVFSSDNNAIAYYLPGTSGWGSTFGGIPTALWLPQVSSPGVQSNRFGFTVSWATSLSVVVEAATDLGKPNWLPLATNALSGSTFDFSDPQWKNYPSRFYRVRAQ